MSTHAAAQVAEDKIGGGHVVVVQDDVISAYKHRGMVCGWLTQLSVTGGLGQCLEG